MHAGAGVSPRSPRGTTIRRGWDALRAALPAPRSRWHYLAALLAVAAATAGMVALRGRLDTLNVALVFLLLCLVFGVGAGSGPAALVAVLSFLAFNFFFIPPYYTLTVDRGTHVLALFTFLGVALVTGQLVARVRQRTDLAVREQRRTALLYELNAALVGDIDLDAILAAIVERVVSVYGSAQCRILLPDAEGMLRVAARFPAWTTADIDRANLAVANWVIEHRAPAGRGTAGRRIHRPQRSGGSTRPPNGPDVLYLPIATADRVVGVLEVAGRPGGGRFQEEDERLLTSFADQAALALERARLTEEAARAAALAQSDELKSALLAAVSHDLRTPLASIKAAATALLDASVAWDQAARREFLEAIDEETDRLTLMVGNLLDLSRIEGGAVRPEKEWYDVAELVADVAHRLAGRAAGHRLTSAVEPALPVAYFDYVEIAQVLTNLVENAVKYTPPGTAIAVSARRAGHGADDAIEVAVRDDGPGIPAAKQPRLFEKFFRAHEGSRVPGTGIGLAISKGLVEAHGGRLWVESREGEGTTFRFTLPLGPAPPAPPTPRFRGEPTSPSVSPQDWRAGGAA